VVSLQERDRQLNRIVDEYHRKAMRQFGADLDEARQMSLVFFWRHPDAEVSPRSVFQRRLRSLQLKRARMSTFDSQDLERSFTCRAIL